MTGHGSALMVVQGALRHRRKMGTTYGRERQFRTRRCGNVASRMSVGVRGAS